jgi:hypothetical protein
MPFPILISIRDVVLVTTILSTIVFMFLMPTFYMVIIPPVVAYGLWMIFLGRFGIGITDLPVLALYSYRDVLPSICFSY